MSFGFAGEYTDPTGLIYLRARYYDPATAQFITRDPLEALTHRPYTYAASDPADNIDPTGLSPFGVWLGIADGACALTAEIPAVDVGTCGGAGLANAAAGAVVAGGAIAHIVHSHGHHNDGDSVDETPSATGDPVPDTAQPPDAADRCDLSDPPSMKDLDRLTDAEAKRITQRYGTDPEEVKKEIYGPRTGKYDLYRDAQGRIWAGPKHGPGEPQPTGMER